MTKNDPNETSYLSLGIIGILHFIALFLAIDVYAVWVPRYIKMIADAVVKIPQITLWIHSISDFMVSYWPIVGIAVVLLDIMVCLLLLRKCAACRIWQWSSFVLFLYILMLACTCVVLCLPLRID